MSLYSETTRSKVIKVAKAAVSARQKGNNSYATELQTFVLGPVYNSRGAVIGYCNRYIRQLFEAALNLQPFTWAFGAGTADETLIKLKPYIKPVGTKPQPGDIIGWRKRRHGDPGHIALYIGGEKGLIAENTSAERGDPDAPGTKVTRLANTRTGWKAYRLFPTDK